MTAQRTTDDVLQDIVDVLDGTVWTSDTTDRIARILRDYGYVIRDREDYVYLEADAEVGSSEADLPTCDFCHTVGHTVRDCQNIDPEQLATAIALEEKGDGGRTDVDSAKDVDSTDEPCDLETRIATIVVTVRVERVGDSDRYRVVLNHDGPIVVDNESYVVCSALAYRMIQRDFDMTKIAETVEQIKANTQPDLDALNRWLSKGTMKQDAREVECVTDASRCDVVVAALKRLGYDKAYSSHSGGGIFCIYIPDVRFGDEEWIFGMANETWGGYRLDASGFDVDGTQVETGVPSDASDPAALEQVAIDIDRILRNL